MNSFTVTSIGYFLIFASGIAAYHDKMFTVRQMRRRGIATGLPFVWHFGMWGDAFLVSPLLAHLIGTFGYQWSSRAWIVSGAIGAVMSLGMHLSYLQAEYPEAHVQKHRLTVTGWLHFGYMALAFTVLILFYFKTKTPPPEERAILIVFALLVAHMIAGTHLLLGGLKQVFGGRGRFDWTTVPPPFQNFAGKITVCAVITILAWRSATLVGR